MRGRWPRTRRLLSEFQFTTMQTFGKSEGITKERAAKSDVERHSPENHFGSIGKLSRSSLKAGSTGSKNGFLHSSASLTMYCGTMEIDKSSYNGNNKESIHLDAGSENTKIIDSGTYFYDAMRLPNYLLV